MVDRWKGGGSYKNKKQSPKKKQQDERRSEIGSCARVRLKTKTLINGSGTVLRYKVQPEIQTRVDCEQRSLTAYLHHVSNKPNVEPRTNRHGRKSTNAKRTSLLVLASVGF